MHTEMPDKIRSFRQAAFSTAVKVLVNAISHTADSTSGLKDIVLYADSLRNEFCDHKNMDEFLRVTGSAFYSLLHYDHASFENIVIAELSVQESRNFRCLHVTGGLLGCVNAVLGKDVDI